MADPIPDTKNNPNQSLNKQAFDLFHEHGSYAEASRASGIPASTLRDRINKHVEESVSIPKDFLTTGISTLYDSEGNIRAQWIKEQLDSEKMRSGISEAVRSCMLPLRGLAVPSPLPKQILHNIKTEYILTDLHLGQYSWGEETGDNYNLKKATNLAVQAIDRLVESVPSSESCILNQMGDFFHADSNTPATPTSGNHLDTDTRHRLIVREGIKLAKYAVERALEKHKTVEVRNTPGNHDIHSAIILDEALKAYFEKEQRVIIHDSPRAFWAYKFGRCLVGIAHGHAPKPNKLPGLLAADYPEWWGQCEFKYCRHGHMHHNRSFTDMSVITEGFPTLAARDAWATGEGFRSGRSMIAIVLDKDCGEIERHTASIKRLENGSV